MCACCTSEIITVVTSMGDRLIILATPAPFASVSNFYQQFPQVETTEALTYLQNQ